MKKKFRNPWHWYKNPDIRPKGKRGRKWDIYIEIIECRILAPLLPFVWITSIIFGYRNYGMMGITWANLSVIGLCFVFGVIPNILSALSNLTR